MECQKNLDRYWKEDPLLKEKAAGEVMFDVFDIDKQEYVFRTGWQPLVGEVAVPVAGRHRLKVHALGKWSVSFIEDKAALEAAAKRGEIQPGKTIDQAKLSSGSTRRDKLQAAKISALAELENLKAR
ncbi:MAG: hypothetical protein HC767_07180 [Akkermansiaceae bacterium]|nr:hypothetical protein [Akkermansiaceae bacterium]